MGCIQIDSDFNGETLRRDRTDLVISQAQNTLKWMVVTEAANFYRAHFDCREKPVCYEIWGLRACTSAAPYKKYFAENLLISKGRNAF